MRASQPDAAMYYLARMVEAGEDPLFIARRMVIFASEDVGLAQPTALVVDKRGIPRLRDYWLPRMCHQSRPRRRLSRRREERPLRLRRAPRKGGCASTRQPPHPEKVRNAVTKLMKELDYGKDHEKYPSTPLEASEPESYLPDKINKKKYLK